MRRFLTRNAAGVLNDARSLRTALIDLRATLERVTGIDRAVAWLAGRLAR
jgi:hypothetical protein